MSERQRGRRIDQGLGYFSHTMDVYDRFRQSIQEFTQIANWMLIISAVTFVCSLWYFSRFFVTDGSIDYRLIPLSVIFFGISALSFSVFRGILFLIQSLLERSTAKMQTVKATRIPTLRDRAVAGVAQQLEYTLTDSVALWWDAHRITIRTIFIVIPGFLFYFLGLASLLAHVFGLVWNAI